VRSPAKSINVVTADGRVVASFRLKEIAGHVIESATA
jgi:hypothetical protein